MSYLCNWAACHYLLIAIHEKETEVWPWIVLLLLLPWFEFIWALERKPLPRMGPMGCWTTFGTFQLPWHTWDRHTQTHPGHQHHSPTQSTAWTLLRVCGDVKTKPGFDCFSVKINNFSASNPQPDTNSPCFRIGPLVFYENKCLFYCHKNHSASVNESLFPVGIILCTWTLSSFWSSRLGFKNNFNFIASMGRASQ